MLNLIKKILPNSIKTKIRLIKHSGKRYICPFCNYSSKDLALLGFDEAVLFEKQVVGGGLRSAGCYKCGSSDRDRLLLIYLKEEYKLLELKNIDLTILHIAPEWFISN